MPNFMESQKLTTPRMTGRRAQAPWLMVPVGSTFTTISSPGFRQTMAVFLGPRIRMPSMRAWPAMLVLLQTLLDIGIFLLFYFAVANRGRVMRTLVPWP